ncbi:MAG: hypothetical protein ACFFA0_14505 [Promethearchaeota archaeon]
MTDIYVPIDYSNLRAIIPPGEDIIYSTLCTAKIRTSSGIMIGYVRFTIKKWNTHVLMTPNGFAYIDGRYNPPQAFYDDWYNVWTITKRRIMYESGGGLHFIVKPDNKYESSAEFRIRLKNFVPTIRPILEARKKEWELLFPNKRERKKKAWERHSMLV